MRKSRSLAAIVLTVCMCFGTQARAQSPIAHTASGDLVGDGADIHLFKDVPYAAPPVGPLRGDHRNLSRRGRACGMRRSSAQIACRSRSLIAGRPV